MAIGRMDYEQEFGTRNELIMKAIKGLRFYTYQEAAKWLECRVIEVEEMVARRALLAYRFSHDEEPYVSEQALLASTPDPWYWQREVPVV